MNRRIVITIPHGDVYTRFAMVIPDFIERHRAMTSALTCTAISLTVTEEEFLLIKLSVPYIDMMVLAEGDEA